MRLLKFVLSAVLAGVSFRLIYLAVNEYFAKNGEVAVYYLLIVWLIPGYFRLRTFGSAPWPIAKNHGNLLVGLIGALFVFAYLCLRTVSSSSAQFDASASFLFIVSWLYLALAFAVIFGDGAFGSVGRWISEFRMRHKGKYSDF